MPGRKGYKGGAGALKLSGSLTSGAASFSATVDPGSSWPDGSGSKPFVVELSGVEKVLCSARTGANFTVASSGRGYDGTTAQAHTDQAAVEHVLDADTLDEANAHANDLGTGHGPAGLAADSVTTVKILNGAVTAAKIANDTITATQIAPDAVGASELANSAVDTAALAASAVTYAKLAADVADLIFGVGDIKWQAHDTPLSARWVVANGTAVSRATYAALFALIGTRYGTGDGTTTFNLPNLVGAQLEGVASNAGVANKTADSHTHTKSGSVSSASATHSHTGATASGGPGNHDHNDFDGTSPSTTGGPNQSLAHVHGVSVDNAAHSHTDTLAYAAASVSSVTKAVPFVRVS